MILPGIRVKLSGSAADFEWRILHSLARQTVRNEARLVETPKANAEYPNQDDRLRSRSRSGI
jgi:hypothetical protein